MKYIKVNNIKLNTTVAPEKAIKKAIELTGAVDVQYQIIAKRSIDARKKPNIQYVYSIILGASKFNKKNKNAVILKSLPLYQYNISEHHSNKYRPVIVGFGPAGMFLSLLLAENGFNPIIIERGQQVEQREKQVNDFWNTNMLNTESNVQFGEGGAGTFSDGKLNTGIKDKNNRIPYILRRFVEFGANETITYDAKPHVGTDVLKQVVMNMREYIKSQGGEFMFDTKFESFEYNDDSVTLVTNNGNIETDFCCLAIGNSSRDTFTMLQKQGFNLETKPFAVGVRAEHKQKQINLSQYGFEDNRIGAAPYKLTYNTSNQRGVYSFCMCPGGYVVNASSENEKLCVNGMSYSKRDGENANSAIVVTVNDNDYGHYSKSSDIIDPLSGMYFQRDLEQSAYEEGQGLIPVQTLGSFKANKIDDSLGSIKPNCKGNYNLANLRNVLPDYICEAIIEAMDYFGNVIDGFDDDDVVLSAIESRTSSPVRIVRDDNMMTNKQYVYAAGEGAGFAGGIVSSAVDGMKMFEKYIDIFN